MLMKHIDIISPTKKITVSMTEDIVSYLLLGMLPMSLNLIIEIKTYRFCSKMRPNILFVEIIDYPYFWSWQLRKKTLNK